MYAPQCCAVCTASDTCCRRTTPQWLVIHSYAHRTTGGCMTDPYENCSGRGRHGRDWGTLDDKGNWTPIEATPVLPILGRVIWAIGWGAVLLVACVLLVAAAPFAFLLWCAKEAG